MNKFYFPKPSFVAIPTSDTEFKIGDKVYADYGLSGKLGPGTISGRIEFEDFTGFVVSFPITPYESSEMGWFQADQLIPA